MLAPGVATGYIDIPITSNYQLTQPVTFQVVLQAPAGASGPATMTTQTVEIEPPTPLPPPPPPPALVPLVIESTSPAAGSTVSALPAKIVLTFNTDLVGLTDGGSAIPVGDYNALSLTIGSRSIAISTVYNELANGTSTITVSPASSPLILMPTTETLSIDLKDYADADGEHVTNPADGTLSFTVTNGTGSITIPGQGSSVTIYPPPILTAKPGSTSAILWRPLDTVAGQSLVYSLGPGRRKAPRSTRFRDSSRGRQRRRRQGQTYSIPVIAAVSGELNVYSTRRALGDGGRVAERGEREDDGTEKGPQEQGDRHDHGDLQPGNGGIGGVVKFLFGRHAQDQTRPQEKGDEARSGCLHLEAVAPNQVKIQLTKPSKLKLQLIVRGDRHQRSGRGAGGECDARCLSFDAADIHKRGERFGCLFDCVSRSAN